MKILNVFENRVKPFDFHSKELFSLGVMNPRTIYASRKAYKTKITMRSARIFQLAKDFAIENKSINFLDVGARGGVQDFLREFENYFCFFLSEPELSELKTLQDSSSSQGKTVINRGFHNKDCEVELYVTDHPGCSSILYPEGPGIEYRSTFTKNPNQFKVVGVQKIPVTRIDEYFSSDRPVHVLKIDVQGAEYEILEGLGTLRPCLIQCEISTFEHYKNQKTLLQIMTLLDSYGYFPIVLPVKDGHGDAIFVPSFTTEGRRIFSQNSNLYEFILTVFGLDSYGKWSAEYFRRGEAPRTARNQPK